MLSPAQKKKKYSDILIVIIIVISILIINLISMSFAPFLVARKHK